MVVPKMPSYLQIFIEFLKLGCTAFGGPAAHLIFFHQQFVQRLKWLNEQQYAQIMGLAQMLPGPTSSQVGLSIGYVCKGYLGAMIAWLAFTLPSAVLMSLIAVLGIQYLDLAPAVIFHILQLLVFSVVAWAFWQMVRSLCQSTWHYALMLLGAGIVLGLPALWGQILVIAVGAVAGLCFAQTSPNIQKITVTEIVHETPFQNNTKPYLWLCSLAGVAGGLALWHMLAPNTLSFALAQLFKIGSLVFGGGHVVLPMLHESFVTTGFIQNEPFDLGYAAVQLMPGPLFTFASYVGALLPMTPHVWLNVMLATVLIFLPSFFLMFGLLPYWTVLAKRRDIAAMVVGINASIVGLLLAMLLNMLPKYFMQWSDFIFVMLLIMALKCRIRIVWVLSIGFLSYFVFLHYFIPRVV